MKVIKKLNNSIRLNYGFIIYLLFTSFFTVNSIAQQQINENNDLKFENITTDDGLLHNSIKTTFQDSKGYLWIGTINGLYKYNGDTFKIYYSELGKPNTLFGNNIRTVYEDKQGVLWIGTNKGLCIYNREKNSFNRFFLNSDIEESITLKADISSIYQDHLSNIWVGTSNGLYKLNSIEQNNYSHKYFSNSENKNSLSSNFVRAITQDHHNNTWIATFNGLNKLNYVSKDSVDFSRIDHEILKKSNISKMLIDHNNKLWIVAGKEIYNVIFKGTKVFEIQNKNFQKSNSSEIKDHYSFIHQDSKKTFWIGTINNGLIEYNSESNTFKRHRAKKNNPHYLKSNNIFNIFEDKSAVLWIGTIRGGLSKLDLQKKKIDHFNLDQSNPSSLSGDLINSIYQDSQKNIWIGTFGKGLNLLPANSSKSQFIKLQLSNTSKLSNIQSICEDKYGNIWMGVSGVGLAQVKLLSDNTLKIKIFDDLKSENSSVITRIPILYKDKTGTIWMAGNSSDGLLKFNPSRKFGESPRLSNYTYSSENSNSLPGNQVSAIHEDSEGVLWVGTYGNGLVRIERNQNNTPSKYTRIIGNEKSLTSLNNNSVFSILEDSEKNILVGTFGGGINKISKNQKNESTPIISHLTTKNGLPSNEIYGIIEDNNSNLWISTNNGISNYDISQKQFYNLNVSDGLQGLNFRKGAYLKSDDSKMYFGGVNGVNAFYPDEFISNDVAPNVELTDFKIFNKKVHPNEEVDGTIVLEKEISETENIILNHEHNSFSFEFVALHFAVPAKNKYKYKLEGLHTNWIETDHTRRFASFANLNNGEYTFKVKAANNDGLWNEIPKTISIKVLPPIWKTWWAYLIYSLFAVFLMWLFNRYIVIREGFRNKIKIEKIEQEKIKELNKMKLEFFTNISHEFKTPLALILGPLQNLLKVKETDPELKESISIMERNANHLLRLINQVMEFRKVEANELKVNTSRGNLIKFCEDILANFNVLAKKKEINLSFKCEVEVGDIETYCDWDKMEKILNNLISNSIKYTPDSGNVKVSLSFINNGISKQSNVLDVNSEIEIIVEDTGVGIPKNKISKIFRRFYQVEESNKSNSFGSGVGLALTKKLIDLLQGHIEVKSNLNEGSQFIVKFPVITSKTDVMREAEISSEKVIVSESGLVINENIQKEIGDSIKTLPSLLIVEDNPDMQTFLKSSLEGSYKILQAYDGVQGLKIALENIPNIIISDVMMPNMDGIQFCNEIKQNEITNHVPLILLSARASIDHKIEGLKVRADAYIPKPFDMRLLKIKIQKLIEEREFLIEKFASKGITLDSQKIGINHTEKAFLEKSEKVIEDNLMNSEFGVEDLGRALSFSRMQLYRKFKSVRGLSANEFIRAYRIKKAALLLRETDLNVSEILYTIGFTNRSYFSKCFKKTFDMSPKEYSKKYREKLKRERDSEIE